MRVRRNLFGYDGTASSPEYDPTPIPSSSESSGVYLEPMEVEEEQADEQSESFSMYIGEINEAVVLDPERVAAQIHYEFINVEPLMESTQINAPESPPRVPIENPPIAFNVEDDDFDGAFFDNNLENAEGYLTPCDESAFNLLHEESMEELF